MFYIALLCSMICLYIWVPSPSFFKLWKVCNFYTLSFRVGFYLNRWRPTRLIVHIPRKLQHLHRTEWFRVEPKCWNMIGRLCNQKYLPHGTLRMDCHHDITVYRLSRPSFVFSKQHSTKIKTNYLTLTVMWLRIDPEKNKQKTRRNGERNRRYWAWGTATSLAWQSRVWSIQGMPRRKCKIRSVRRKDVVARTPSVITGTLEYFTTSNGTKCGQTRSGR